MQNILLLGAGRSSTALIDYLLKHAKEDDYFLTVGDLSEELALKKTGNHPLSAAFAFDINNSVQRRDAIEKADIVISLLPPTMHFLAAHDCITIGRHLITASYITSELNNLDGEAIRKNILLLNECGLDPGIDHMSAMDIIHRLKNRNAEIVSFRSYTGGLIAPESVDNEWGYKFTWNPRNVILAGQGTAKFIENGKYHYIPYPRLFTTTEKFNIDGFGMYEGYPNRDSLAYRKHYGIEQIPTLIRGTLRNESFCSAWNIFVQIGLTDDTYVVEDSEHLTYSQWVTSLLPETGSGQALNGRIARLCGLASECNELKMIASTGILEDQVIGLKRATPAQILQDLLEKKWKLNENDKDLIIMHHLFEYRLNGKMYKLTSTLTVKGENQLMTAMAKTVGYPLGIVARLILKNRIKRRGVMIPVYPDIYQPILAELGSLGIQFNEIEEAL